MSRPAAPIERPAARGFHRVRRRHALYLALIALAALAACESKPPAPQPSQRPQLTLAPVSFDALPGWGDDAVGEALSPLARSCAARAALPDTSPAGPVGSRILVRDWRAACAALAAVDARDQNAARAYLERWFQPFRAANRGDPDGLFTGYYEIELRGAKRPGGRFNVPIYGVPGDLVTANLGDFDDSLAGKRVTGRVVGTTLKPYPTRRDIEAGALDGKAPVLAWIDDPVAAFFLAVQGSGRVTLGDGTVMRLGYGAQNGRAYRSIGRILVDRGAMPLEQVSLQSIRAWLRDHPGEAKALMDENPSYVFFRLLPGEGPLGSEGVALTPGRSLAIDPAYLSYGVPIWLDAEGIAGGPRLRRLVVAQDTGSAIKGPVRGDLFWGYGTQAEDLAGHMRAHGGYYLLLPRPAP